MRLNYYRTIAAKNLSAKTAHISKLTEAAWLQDARTPRDRRARIRELFRSYQQAGDAIIMGKLTTLAGEPTRGRRK